VSGSVGIILQTLHQRGETNSAVNYQLILLLWTNDTRAVKHDARYLLLGEFSTRPYSTFASLLYTKTTNPNYEHELSLFKFENKCKM